MTSDVSFFCKLYEVDSVTAIRLDQDLENVFLSAGSDTALTTANIHPINAVIYVDVDQQTVTFNFMNITCEREGEYTIQINNRTEAMSTFQLYIVS